MKLSPVDYDPFAQESAKLTPVDYDPFEKIGEPIDLSRPKLTNPDGSFSTEETITIDQDGKWYNIPTIVDGQRVGEDRAIELFQQGKNQHVGEFDSLDAATQSARQRTDQIGKIRGAAKLTPVDYDPFGDPSAKPSKEPEYRSYEPTLWDRVQDLIGPNKDAAAVELAARRIADEEGLSVDEVYKQAGGQRAMFNPEGRSPIRAGVEAGKVVAKQLPEIAPAAANTVLRVIRGGDISADPGLIDRWIEGTDTPPPKDADPNYESFQGIGKSLGFSLLTLASSATAAAGGTAAGGPVGGVAAGMAAGGAVAYRASKDDFLSRVKDGLDAKSDFIYGRPLNEQEWGAAMEEYETAAMKYGAWEAIPEAISNLVFLKALSAPLKGANKTFLRKTMERAQNAIAQGLPSEHATETATGVGQSYAEHEAGLREKPLTVGEAFKQQVIPTTLVTLGMGGAGALAKGAYDFGKARLGKKNETTLSDIANASDEDLDAMADEFLADSDTEAAPSTPAEKPEAAPDTIYKSDSEQTPPAAPAPKPDVPSAIPEDTRITADERREDPQKRARVETLKQRITALQERVIRGEAKPEELMGVIQELHTELTTDSLTGLPNRRAFNERPRKAAAASIDLDGLKWINDNMSHGAGDEMFRQVGAAFKEALGEDVNRFDGDEFGAQGDDPVALENTLKDTQNRLAGAKISVTLPNGETITKNGIEFTYVIDKTYEAADARLKSEKQARADAGLRAERGGEPPGVVRTPAARQPDNQRGDPASLPENRGEQRQQGLNTDTTQDTKTPASSGVFRSTQEETPNAQEQETAQAEVLKPRTFDSRRPETPQTTPSPEGVSVSGQTNTKAFRDWFKGSKVVDENGEPLVVYHWTDSEFDAFDTERNEGAHFGTARAASDRARGMDQIGYDINKDDDGFWVSIDSGPRTGEDQGPFTTQKEAKDWIKSQPKRIEAMAVYLSIQNPVDMPDQGTWNVWDIIRNLPDDTLSKAETDQIMESDNRYGALKKALLGKGIDGIRYVNEMEDAGSVSYIAFRPEQIKSAVGNRGTFDPKKPSIMDSRSATQASKPGTQYAPLIEQSGNLPAVRQTEVVMADGRKIQIPEEPVRRTDIVKRLEKAFGVRVYQGRVKGKSRLGFYRTGVGEIRTKHTDHLEVTAHELAHWLDDRFVWIGNLYRSKPYRKEVLSVSYDDKKIHEGYAEFMRLFFTDETQAMEKAPNFYRAFVDKLKGTTLEAPIKDIQGMMHAWYRQGALMRARSKHGETPAGALDDIKEFREWLSTEAKAQLFDSMANIARVEKTLTGRIGGAFSPYWSARITQRVGAIMDAVINHGTVGYDKAKNALYFTGESLENAVLSKIKGREREFGEYMIGRRAKELRHQGREILYRSDEIDAFLNHANEHKDFPRIFQAYQAFNKRMIDLLVQSGVTSRERAEKIMEINQNYVSFKRVVDSFGKHGKSSRQNNPFMRLKGGTANVRNVFETLQENMETFIRLATMNQFKAQFYHMIDSSQDSAMFAAKIGRDVKPVEMNKAELADKLNKILGDKWKDSGIQIDEELLADLVMFTGVDPKGNVDFYYQNGEKVFYEIIDGSLYKDLVGLDGERMGLTFKVWDTVFGKPKRLLTATATAFNLKFQIRNFLMRDMANRIYFTRARKDNPIRIAGQAFKGLAESFMKSDAYWLARANGLGMESTYVGSQYAHVKKAGIAPAFNWWQRINNMKDKAVDAIVEFAGHTEMANRLAEYDQLVAEGKTPREAAIGGIDVSVDFRRRGRHELVRYIANGSAFLNPRIQGLYKIAQEMTDMTEEQKNPYIRRRAAVVAARALWTTTLPAMALWFWNHDDERYKNLPDDVRDQNFVIFTGSGKDDYFLFAKSFEMGSVFASVPERILDAIKEREGRELAESMALMASETMSLNPLPSVLQIEQEIRENKTWTGAPIIPDWLNDTTMENARYFDDQTSETAKWLGEKMDVRPDRLEHRFRGYTSMIGDITLTMTDYMLRQENQIDPKMTYQDYVSKYIGIVPRSGEPHRTEAQKDFYDLAKEADKVFNTYADLMKRPGNYDTLDQRLQDYLNPPEREVYYSTKEAFDDARAIISDLNNVADLVRQDTRLSAEEKRVEMEKIKAGKNQVYETITKEFSPEKLKELERQVE